MDVHDHPAWLAAERVTRLGMRAGRRLATWRRQVRVVWRLRRRPDGVPSWGGSRHPVVQELAAIEAGAAGGGESGAATRELQRLRLFLRSGAYARAHDSAARIEGRLDQLDGPARTAGVALLIELGIATGERDRAVNLARRHQIDLEGTDGGQTLLQLLGLAPPRSLLPGGAIDRFAVSRMIRAGAMDAAELGRLLRGRHLEMLRNPELHLLLASAWRGRDPARAEVALNRYLRALALPGCAWPSGSANALRDLRFAAGTCEDGGPLVSVIVAAHQAAGTIDYAIDSLRGQTYRNLEILIGDDASSDRTRELAEAHRRADARVRVFASAANQGAYNLRNQLIARARGELLAFHDADDLALPTRIARQVADLRDHGAAAGYGSWVRVDAGGQFHVFRDQRATRLCLASLIIPRERLRALGGFRGARFAADLELYERLRERHGEAGLAIVRAPVVFGLWSEASVTRRAGSEATDEGYRAPARRAYSDLIFERLLDPSIGDAAFEAMLRSTGNHADPAAVTEIMTAAGQPPPAV